MDTFTGMYNGVIDEVYPPGHVMNTSIYQYMYRVLLNLDGMANANVICIQQDPYGSYHNYLDSVLAPGYRVFVQFPNGDRTLGVITGGSRFRKQRTDPAQGIIYEHRFNEVVNTIDFKGAWTTRSINGPYVSIEKQKITLSDTPIKQDGVVAENYKAINDAALPITQDPFDGQFIVLDKVAGELHINTNQFKVVVNKNADVHVRQDSKVVIDGAANITVGKDATLNVQGGVNATIGKDLTANVAGEAKLKAGKDITVTSSGKTYVTAKEIQLNGQTGMVLTNVTDPVVDLITGVPTMGVPTVKSG